jgi:UDP-glucose 4-epimerase
MKNILIVGAQSYIGDSFKKYINQWSNQYRTKILATRGLKLKKEMFENIDVIFCVVGVAHIKETDKNRHMYFDINRDLVVAIAKIAKEVGVKQFVLLSSMSVYGKTVGHIKKSDVPSPNTAYGESKYQADVEIKKLEDKNFIFTCLRPPMVYGKDCTGNYQSLRKFALKSPVFPNYKNLRSMIYIENLCEFIKEVIDQEKSGLFFPQNAEYTNTSEMVRWIAEEHGKKIKLIGVFNWIIRFQKPMIIKKVFGSLTYEPVDMVETIKLKESIKDTENEY